MSRIPQCFDTGEVRGKRRAHCIGGLVTKLGATWEPTEAERAYNEGRSTQVPVNPVVRVKGRFSRRLRDGILELMLER